MNKNSTFHNFRTARTLMQGSQIENSSIEKFSTTRKFSMPTLMEEKKSVVMAKFEFEKLKLKGFLWNFRTIRMLMQGRKTMIFSWILVYRYCVLDWDLDWANWTSFGWELIVWISININLKSTYWNIWTVTNLLHGSKQEICLLNCPPQTENFRRKPC